MQARMLALNVGLPAQTPEEMGNYLVEDTKRVAELIKLTNIKLE
jgi:hypothetical protein